MIYRLATHNDITTIVTMMNKIKQNLWQLNLDIWDDEYPSLEIIEDDISNNMGMVVEDNNSVVAYLAISLFDEDYEEVFPEAISKIEFGRVMVDLDYQNKGYGQFLVEQTIKLIKEKGYHDICITVDYFNQKAIHIYEKLGFKYLRNAKLPWGEMALYYYYIGE